jgi:hypothetical protein
MASLAKGGGRSSRAGGGIHLPPELQISPSLVEGVGGGVISMYPNLAYLYSNYPLPPEHLRGSDPSHQGRGASLNKGGARRAEGLIIPIPLLFPLNKGDNLHPYAKRRSRQSLSQRERRTIILPSPSGRRVGDEGNLLIFKSAIFLLRCYGSLHSIVFYPFPRNICEVPIPPTRGGEIGLERMYSAQSWHLPILHQRATHESPLHLPPLWRFKPLISPSSVEGAGMG